MTDDKKQRRLHWNGWLGLMWGQVPIGLIIGLSALIFVYFYFYIILE